MWKVRQSSVVSENGDSHETYGISKGDTVITDVSLDKNAISELVNLLNTLDVSEVHAREIVEDFLGR